MANISEITGLAIASVSKVCGLAIDNIAEVIDIIKEVVASFTDDNAVAKSISTGTGQRVWIETTENYSFDHNDPFTVSFWIKAGWTYNLNTNTHLFSSSNTESTSVNNDTFRIWFDERYNRLYAEWRQDGSNKRQNFWLFHANYGVYEDAYDAAGLGATYWLSSNRGNANSDGYTLITVTRGTTNSAASSNLKFYWNATDCGAGYYASGTGGGTPSFSQDAKSITLGSISWQPWQKCGDTNETKFNGVTIWDKVLDASEITELYNSGTPMDVSGHSAYDDSCKGWWNFESDGSNEVAGGPAFTFDGDSNIEAK
jgi:hypothetical protein